MSSGTDSWADFSSHISYDASVGVRVRVISSDQTSDLDFSSQFGLGTSVIETLLSQGDALRPIGKDEERDELWLHLHQLRARMDVMTAMLDRLSAHDIPPYYAIRLNEYGCEVAAESGLLALLTAPTRVELRLHFDGCRAVPLILPGRYDPAHPNYIGFDSLPASLSEGLGKLTFRQHRQQIAAARLR